MTRFAALRPVLVSSLLLLAASLAPAQRVELGLKGKGMALVSDPAASGGTAVAVKIGEVTPGEASRWALTAAPAKPGLYQLDAAVRLLLPPDFDHTRLKLKLSLRGDGKLLAERQVASITLNPVGYAPVLMNFSLPKAAALELLASWEIAEPPVGQPKKQLRAFKAPVVGNLEADPAAATAPEGGELADLMTDMASEKAVSLSAIDYPALLLDRADVNLITDSLAIETVLPEKIHVYPGESNAITVVIRNYRATPASASLKVTMRTGLSEESVVGEKAVTIPGGSTAEQRFDWVSGSREFGHEVHAEVTAGGKAAHSASEYFTVSAPLWKTAIQGSGFLDWYGREQDFPGHVAASRRGYINVEEAFSWQPSSWTDLNPTNSDWWTGQNNFHNSLSGLQQWMALNHAQGIKMISYIWSTASGPSGFEWGRKHPDLVALADVGLCTEFFDVEDLRLADRLHNDPAFDKYQYSVWHSLMVNMGYLRLIEMGADQLIQSAHRFGWDGVRFDCGLGWSAMGTDDVKAELREMGAEGVMQKLAPDLMSITDKVWSAQAISIRNVRYMKHRLREGNGPHFEIASNYGPIKEKRKPDAPDPLVYFGNYCSGGSQVNQEYFRGSRSWKTYCEGLLEQVELTRQAGGFHAVQSLDGAAGGAGRTYNNIFTFASGSHPYIYSEGGGSPGHYARFMTRYGEFLWDPALAPVTPEAAGVAVKAEAGLLWKPYVKQRVSEGARLTVMQLITPPGADETAPAKPMPMAPWMKAVRVSKAGSREPAAWLLTAEPDCLAVKLPVEKEAGGFAVVVPEHRLWSTIVWIDREEKP